MPNSCKYIATIRSEKIGEEKRKETETCNASMFVPRLVRLVSFHLISCVALRLTSNTCKHTHTTAQCLSKLFVVFFFSLMFVESTKTHKIYTNNDTRATQTIVTE